MFSGLLALLQLPVHIGFRPIDRILESLRALEAVCRDRLFNLKFNVARLAAEPGAVSKLSALLRDELDVMTCYRSPAVRLLYQLVVHVPSCRDDLLSTPPGIMVQLQRMAFSEPAAAFRLVEYLSSNSSSHRDVLDQLGPWPSQQVIPVD